MPIGWPRANALAIAALVGGVLHGAGCESFRARRTFAGAGIGEPWSQVSGAERYSQEDQLAFWSMEGPGEMDGTDYFVVVSDSSTVSAKAYSLKGHPSAFGLETTAGHLRELREVQSHYPYTRAVSRVDGFEFHKPVYPPLVNPDSADDTLLASGVRKSTWAILTNNLWGWPFESNHEGWIKATKVWWKGQRRTWAEFLELFDGIPDDAVVTIWWGKGPLSR